nr:nucleobase-ascorbate transporter 2 [Tanacetum cinerariifolium]
MRAIQGALIVASSVQIILGYSQLWAICSRFFSPVGMVPVIALAGFGLFDRGFPVRFLATMRAIQGALIVASSVQIILGYSQLWAICSRFFSPVGMVPVIALAGFGLFDRGFPV